MNRTIIHIPSAVEIFFYCHYIKVSGRRKHCYKKQYPNCVSCASDYILIHDPTLIFTPIGISFRLHLPVWERVRVSKPIHVTMI